MVAEAVPRHSVNTNLQCRRTADVARWRTSQLVEEEHHFDFLLRNGPPWKSPNYFHHNK
jgi:hypothetical protein